MKKNEQIEGQLTLFIPMEEKIQEDGMIYMSNILVNSGQSLSIRAAKMLRLLISMVKKNDMDFKGYTIGLAELSRILNASKPSILRDAFKLTNELAFGGLTIKRENGRITKMPWCKKAEYDDKKFVLQLNDALSPYLLQLDEFLLLEREEVMRFKTQYGLRMYELLNSRNFGMKFSMEKKTSIYLSIEDIRFALGLDEYDETTGRVKHYKYKNDSGKLYEKVIKPAIRDIEETAADYKITAEPSKARDGHAYCGYDFTIIPVTALGDTTKPLKITGGQTK